MRVWTIQMAQHRKAKSEGIHLFDITLKSGDPFFAPTAELLRAYKNSFITAAEYTEIFQKLMRERYQEDKDHWLKLFQFDEVALACYCPAGEFCHRHLIREYAQGVAKTLDVPFEYAGEIA